MDKGKALRSLIDAQGYDPTEVIFVGNDLPDLDTLDVAGFFVCPADAEPEVLRRADLVLTKRGGRGALRELTDRIYQQNQMDS